MDNPSRKWRNPGPIRHLYKSVYRQRLADRSAWKERAIIWLAAAVTGLVVVAFSLLTEHAIAFFSSVTSDRGWLALLICPAGGIAISWLTRKYFSGSEGSGIPQVIAALKDDMPREKTGLLISVRIAFGKIALGVAGLAAGFSTGRRRSLAT